MKQLEVATMVYRGGLTDSENFDSMMVNLDKLQDPKYRETLQAKVMKMIDDAAYFLETGEIRLN